jgi:hypothetical protein
MKKLIAALLALATVGAWLLVAVSPFMSHAYLPDEALKEEGLWAGRKTYRAEAATQVVPRQIAGPADGWAGGEQKELIVETPYAGRQLLSLSFADTHDQSPPTIAVLAGGKEVERFTLPKGAGQRSEHWTLSGIRSTREVVVPAGLIAAAPGEIALVTVEGSWAAIARVEVMRLPPLWAVGLAWGGGLILLLWGAWVLTVTGGWKGAAVDGALALVSAALTLAGVEYGLRWFAPQPEYVSGLAVTYEGDPDVEHLLKPNVRSIMGFDTNRFGMRDYDRYTQAKPDGVYRILALGDSFTFGMTGVDDVWPNALEKMFEGSVPKVEVLNSGVSGYGQDNEYFYLKKFGLAFEPDMAIVGFFVGNDIGDNYQHNTRLVVEGVLVSPETAERFTKRELTEEARRRKLLNRFHLYRLLKYRNYAGVTALFKNTGDRVRKELTAKTGDCIQGEAMYAYTDPAGWDRIMKDSWAKTVDYMDMTEKLADENGITMVWGLMPGVVQFDDPFAVAYRSAFADYVPGQPEKLLMEAAQARGWKMVDAFGPMNETWDHETRMYYCHDSHYNELGNLLFARAMYDWIMTNKLIPFTTPPKAAVR